MQNKLIAFRLSSMGDVAMLIPVFESFHLAYPNWNIQLVTKKQFCSLFEDMDFVETIPVNPSNQKISFLDLIRLIISLKKQDHRTVLDFHQVIRTHILNAILVILGFRIFKIEKGRAEKKNMIRLREKTLTPLKSVFERYREVFLKAGFHFEMNPNAHLKKISIDKKELIWIGIAPFAKYRSKMYNLDQLKLVIVELAKKDDIKIVVFGHGNKENYWAQEHFSAIQNVEIIIDKYTLREELAIISNLDIMISMDSANGHLAANYGVPVLTIWGTTHPCLGFGPYRQPIENSIFPDKIKYPFLPVSIFGKCRNEYYSMAIDSISWNEIYKKANAIISSKKP